MKHTKHYDVTIAILAFNGEEFLDELLRMVFGQKTHLRYEVLAIDSGSSDQTLAIFKRYPRVRVEQIPNKTFGHGQTRNLAATLANSEFIVYLTQDAVPVDDHWLDSMVEPFGISQQVSCVLGKQVPRAHCFVTLKREVASVFSSFGDDGSISLQRKSDLTVERGITNNFLSDVNSAFRLSALQQVPFQNVNYAEDQLIGIDMLNHGYFKAYAPLGAVYHSHDYPLRKYFSRKFDECVGIRKATGYVPIANRKELVVGSLKATIKDYVFLLNDTDFTFFEKVHDTFWAPFYNVATRLAMRKAARAQTDRQIEKYSLEVAARKKAAQ